MSKPNDGHFDAGDERVWGDFIEADPAPGVPGQHPPYQVPGLGAAALQAQNRGGPLWFERVGSGEEGVKEDPQAPDVHPGSVGGPPVDLRGHEGLGSAHCRVHLARGRRQSEVAKLVRSLQ